MYQMLHFKSLPGAIISIRELKIKALLNFISKWRNSIVQLERPSLGYQVIEFKTFYFPNFSRGRERRKIVQKLHLDVPTIKNFLLVGFYWEDSWYGWYQREHRRDIKDTWSFGQLYGQCMADIKVFLVFYGAKSGCQSPPFCLNAADFARFYERKRCAKFYGCHRYRI